MDDRQIGRIVRAAARSSYGVAGVEAEGLVARIGGLFGMGGVTVSSGERLAVHVNVRVAPGVPGAVVASNVADAVRYKVKQATHRTIDDLTVTVDGIILRPPASEAGRESDA